MSSRYQVVQPKAVLEFYRDLTEISGFELETAGVLKEGKKFWALAKTAKETALKGNDVVKGYILLATSCDGTLATTAMQTLPCPSPDDCEIAVEGRCKPYGRLNVRIGDEDELGSFVFRTTGLNSIRILSARLQYFPAVSGGQLSTLPLELRPRGKSTSQSHRAPIYYVDLTVRSGTMLSEAIVSARADGEQRQLAGFDQAAFEDAARRGFANGAFDESDEDRAAVVEEFFPEVSANPDEGVDSTLTVVGQKPGLAAKLNLKAEKLRVS